MKRYLWIGSFSTDLVNTELQSLGYNNASQHVAQKNLLEAIEDVWNVKFDALGSVLLPDANEKNVRNMQDIKFSHAEGCNDLLVGYKNVKYLNRLLSTKNLLKVLKKRLRGYSRSDEVVVFMYEMRSVCYKAAAVIKRFFPKAKIVLIVPDLPIYMSGSYSILKKTLKFLDSFSMKIRKKHIDKYILFAKPMADYLKIPEASYTVVEGSISFSDIQKYENTKSKLENDILNNKTKVVMYSGVIDESYGIIELIKAFDYLGREYELWITGSGVSSEKVKAMASEKENVRYLGFLPSREDVIQRQKEATALINIRNPKEEASRYCFPSKLFEYMISGTPVISSMIEGIPDEYYSYIIPLDNNSPEEIAKKIACVGNMRDDERRLLVQRAYDFVEKNKNNLTQAKKIISFVE